MSTKAYLREQILEQLKQMDEATYKKRSLQIANQLFQEEVWQRAQAIGITIARFPEVATQSIIERAWLEGKCVSIPETDNKSKTMQFREYRSDDKLVKKTLGLYEPMTKARILAKAEIDLLIVPGVLFRPDGYRIGFGAGFYDRYLAGYEGRTISLCYAEQISTDFTPEAHDLPVQKLVLENNLK
ncbi:5-formyltetrahydrofolate cyclo-ligase [Listeria grandensis FSL F6-0971]|uniref:5-formyltetrahydrofolate cyclo-ligase n=1 Tax=Listeria grandensis FSL F6-0971 TaxID=1265819 RepID=W7BG62_9LIST|nr:5-formyltetrahydrofolate cyclo-ligase [Listeria grandensis]EUJ24872.1 5-formyltetrahydrofolate cyclo-ligase [Listeria grandensis FSL F6-0971]